MIGYWKGRNIFLALEAEEGYALASVLYLVTILSLLAASIVAIKYYANQGALLEIAKVRCDYAAESGIARALSSMSPKEALSSVIENQKILNFHFEDECEAAVEVNRWGAYLRFKSLGNYGKLTSRRSALVGELPGAPYKNALVFASSGHQLILAGSSSIKGSVVTGLPGTATGNLKDRTSPIKVPIEGNVRKEALPLLPEFDVTSIRGELNEFDKMLSDPSDEVRSGRRRIVVDKVGNYSLSEITDSIDQILLNGSITLTGKISRKDAPLYIVARGMVILASGIQLNGLISVFSSSTIEIEKGAIIDQAICYSRKSIRLQEGADISCQCFAPSITLETRSIARYPSILLSLTETDHDSAKQEIILKGGAKAEGSVAILSAGNIFQPEPLLSLNEGSRVTGAVYSDRKMTLDGVVEGTVLTKDFYFYEAPTMYLGWLRSGVIDRTALPSGFLCPSGGSSNSELAVLDWL